MSKIVSIGTANPIHHETQDAVVNFMQQIYRLEEKEFRKLKFLYRQSEIQTRYSVVPDYDTKNTVRVFYANNEEMEPFPDLEKRMEWYIDHAAPLSQMAINDAMRQLEDPMVPTHLITVSCTGMTAPGLDLELMELLDLPNNVQRTSVNFMGCYAAIHALKMGDTICKADKNAVVLIVCTELCTLHFQKEATPDNITSSMLFSDGSAAVVMVPDHHQQQGITLDGFYSEVIVKGKKEMSWNLSSKGFLMTLSGYIPDLLQEDFESFFERAVKEYNIDKNEIVKWAIHPGGKRILDVLMKQLQINNNDLAESRKVLRDYGNMSGPTIVFVLKEIFENLKQHPPSSKNNRIFGAAFGPGLTLETFIASYHA